MRRIGIVLALLCTAPDWASVPTNASPLPTRQDHLHSSTYVCPMHDEIRAPRPGVCRLCGMPLHRVDEHAATTYHLDVRTEPAKAEAGRPLTLTLSVRANERQTLVKDFTVVHEKPFHLFVISRDLEHYFHLHPTQQTDGVWVQTLTLAQPGAYNVYADVLPKGGTPQVLVARLDVPAPDGVAMPSAPPLTPDTDLDRTLGALRVQLSLPEGGLVAGGHQALTFRFADARTGAPVRDLEPYLGAWGHTVMLDGDAQQFVHAHPVEPVDGASGGPQLTFHAAPPEPGTYRVWTQIQRQGRLHTIVFTLPVKAVR